jgi:hypothetical protein
MPLPDVMACELCGKPAGVFVRMRSGFGSGREVPPQN